MTDTQLLAKLLKLFFSFERPEIAGFRGAEEKFLIHAQGAIDPAMGDADVREIREIRIQYVLY